MSNKSATHSSEKDSATARKRRDGGAHSLNHRTERVNAVDALGRALNEPSRMLRPSDILALQRTAGNRAVGQILVQGLQQDHHSHLSIQAKLGVGASDDPYEREADHIAATVMQTSAASVSHIQRQPEEDEEMVQRKPLAASITPMIQRQDMPEADEKDALIQRSSDGRTAQVEPSVEHSIERARTSGQPLPGDLRTRMEEAFGADFRSVRVHSDAESDRLNRALQARAFTTGHSLFFKRGEYSPDSHEGQRLIAHELTHVVQQQGRSIAGKSRTEKGGINAPITQPVHASNVIQRATSLDGPFDDAYAGTLLDESQGRTARSVAGHALDHLSEGAIKKGRIVPKKLQTMAAVYDARKIASFYTQKADMKAVLTSFLADNTVTAKIANMKANTLTEYEFDDFKHAKKSIVRYDKGNKLIPVMPLSVGLSFLKIQTTTDATPNLHIQTMFPKG